MSINRIVLLAGLGILGPGTTGAYYLTKETIGDVLSEDVIFDKNPKDTDLENIWDTLVFQIPSDENKIKTQELKDIKNETNNKKEKLQEWCLSSYDRTYKNLFSKKNEDLMSDVKTVCMITIKAKIGESTLLTTNNTEESKYRQHIEVLKREGSTRELVLEKDLEELRTSSDENAWKKLQGWCEKSYLRGYQGDKSNRVKLVNKFCKKT